MNSSSLRHAHWAHALLLGAAVGCGGGDEAPSTAFQSHGPHGGHTAIMSEGADFEVEFTLNEGGRRMVIYTLDPSSHRPHPLAVDSLDGQFETNDQTIDVTFAADPRPDDPEGQASRFVLGLDKIPQQLMLSDRFVLKLSYAADGKPITASIPHQNDHAHEYHHD